MPIAAIAAIASLAATGIGLGETLSNQPSAPPKPTVAQTDATANQTKQNQEAALSQQLPNVQSETGGSLSPGALAQLTQLLSGQANTPGISAASQSLFPGLKQFLVQAGNNTQTQPSQTGLTGVTSA